MRRLLFYLGCILLFLVLATVDALTQASFTAVRIRLHTGAKQVYESADISVSPPLPGIVTCDQALQSGLTGIVVNPKVFQFDDPDRPMRACTVDISTAPPIAGLPDGTYDLTFVGVRAGVVSENSVRLPVGIGSVTVTVKVVEGLIILK